jgi:hypothetical protein
MGSKVIIYPDFIAGILSIALSRIFNKWTKRAKHLLLGLPILVMYLFILVEIQNKESKADFGIIVRSWVICPILSKELSGAASVTEMLQSNLALGLAWSSDATRPRQILLQRIADGIEITQYIFDAI